MRNAETPRLFRSVAKLPLRLALRIVLAAGFQGGVRTHTAIRPRGLRTLPVSRDAFAPVSAELKCERRPPARERFRDQVPQALGPRARIEETVAHEVDDVGELSVGERNRSSQQRVEAFEHGCNRP